MRRQRQPYSVRRVLGDRRSDRERSWSFGFRPSSYKRWPRRGKPTASWNLPVNLVSGYPLTHINVVSTLWADKQLSKAIFGICRYAGSSYGPT
jgi:hypothetical protein